MNMAGGGGGGGRADISLKWIPLLLPLNIFKTIFFRS